MPRIDHEIREAEFDQWAALMSGDPEFPASYPEWLAAHTASRARDEAAGRRVEVVSVGPQEFAEYCRAIGQPCNWATLGAFTSAKYNKVQFGLRSPLRSRF